MQFRYWLGMLLLLSAADGNAGVRGCVGTMVEIGQCFYDEHVKAEARLNDTYQALLKALDAGHIDEGPPELEIRDSDLVRKAQSAWVTYRDTHCHMYRSKAKGGLDFYGCFIEITDRRTEELAELLEEAKAAIPSKPKAQ